MPDVLAPPATLTLPAFDTRVELRFPEPVSDDAFDAFCRDNPLLRVERDAHGALIIMPPTKGFTGRRGAEIVGQLRNWAREDGTGVYFGSEAGFDLPNGARRSPDAAWVRGEAVQALTDEERAGFLPLCPDVVVELRSSTDRRAHLEAKMEEYLANGARLGWLVDPVEDPPTVTVYRPDADPETLRAPESVPGDPVMPGFTLGLEAVWSLDF